VQRNVTFRIEEEVLRAARKVAINRNTSVNRLVRDYLSRLARESSQQQAALTRLEGIFRTSPVVVGRRAWTRGDLHER
jgi:predicted FMN-binding regulatory protein PaiB